MTICSPPPVEFLFKALMPKALLYEPVVFDWSALAPNALLFEPDEPVEMTPAPAAGFVLLNPNDSTPDAPCGPVGPVGPAGPAGPVSPC